MAKGVGPAGRNFSERASFSELTNRCVGGIYRRMDRYLYKIKSPGWGRRKEFFFPGWQSGSLLPSLYVSKAWERKSLISCIV